MTTLMTTSKQDRGSARTATELEQKYDLASIPRLKVAVELSETGLNKTNAILEEFINATLKSLENMQDQIDGSITTWFEKGVPTLANKPANEWSTEEDKKNHLGDLYYDQDSGYGYRFSLVNNAYEWTRITDNDIVKALAMAAAAQDTADSKRRVFVETPAPPYDSGDLWINGGELYRCQISKDKYQVYEESDFIIATKYTDDTYAVKVEGELKVLSGTVTTIKEGFDSFKVDITTTVDTLDSQLLIAQTSIEANTEEIALKVNKNGVIGAINLSEESAKISAKKIDIEGAVTFSSFDSTTQSMINEANKNSSDALNTVTELENRANNGEFKGDKGDTGATGATGNGIKSSSITYQASASGTTTPTGTWSSSIPSVAAGSYLWTRTILTYTNGTTSTSYSVGKMGNTGAQGTAGATGATGKGVSQIVEQYYLSSSNTTQTGGSWSTLSPTWASGKYIWQRQVITWTDGTTTYTTAVLANALNSANEKAVTALDLATTNDNLIQSWCSENDKTLIDGGKIYCVDLHSIGATIGGWTISEDSLSKEYVETDIYGTNYRYTTVLNKGIHLKYNNDDNRSGYIVMDYNTNRGQYTNLGLTIGATNCIILKPENGIVDIRGDLAALETSVTKVTVENSVLGLVNINRSGSLEAMTTAQKTAGIGFSNDSGGLGYIGMSDVDGSLLRFRYSNTNYYYTVIDTGNYTSYVVPKTGGTFTGKVIINRSGSDVSGTAAGTPSLIIGNPTGAHIAMDVNEIVCKSNATTPSTLVLQQDGGVLQIGNASAPTTFNIYGSTSFASSVGMNAALTVAGNTTLKSGLELQSATPYIDFHFKSSTADYTSRIIENSRGTLTFYSNIIPNANGTRNLGKSGLVWANTYTYALYYTTQSQTSDRRLKTDVTDINSKYLELWDMINPQQFTLIGQDKQSIGVIAQEVEESARMVGLTEQECGFIHKHLKEDGSDYEYGIDYTFISILNHCKLKVVVDTLNELVKKIEILESKC